MSLFNFAAPHNFLSPSPTSTGFQPPMSGAPGQIQGGIMLGTATQQPVGVPAPAPMPAPSPPLTPIPPMAPPVPAAPPVAAPPLPAAAPVQPHFSMGGMTHSSYNPPSAVHRLRNPSMYGRR